MMESGCSDKTGTDPTRAQHQSSPMGVSVCLQHFLYAIHALPVDDLLFHVGLKQEVMRDAHGVSGDFREGGIEGSNISFDGVANAFPVGTFSRHTDVSLVRLQGEMDGDIAIRIHHVSGNGDTVLYEEPFRKRQGKWESPDFPVGLSDGRIYLSCRVRGDFAIRHLGWWTVLENPPLSKFLVCITTYQGNEFVRNMIREICAYEPMRRFEMSLLIVDNGETLNRDQLPDDVRISLLPQPNLGSTGGVMRGLWQALSNKADYLVTIADDGLILPPEILYRLMILQFLVKKPIVVGSMMFYLNYPTVVFEQGARVSSHSYSPMVAMNHRLDLREPGSLERVYEEKSCDYSGSWLMSNPVGVMRFLPAFFLYLDDILQGVLLKRDGIRTIVPPHLFVWQTFGNDFRSYRGYTWYRNDLAMRLTAGLPIRVLPTAWGFSLRILSSLANYDYAQAELLVRSFEDALRPSSWACDPLAGADLIRGIRKNDPPNVDLSSCLSSRYVPLKTRKQPRLVSVAQRLFSWVTMAGYLNPFAKSVASDGGYVFRYHEDMASWQWAGYRKVAVIDREKRGYLCERSWKRMSKLLVRSFGVLFRLLWSIKSLRKQYQKPSLEYKAMWSETFEI